MLFGYSIRPKLIFAGILRSLVSCGLLALPHGLLVWIVSLLTVMVSGENALTYGQSYLLSLVFILMYARVTKREYKTRNDGLKMVITEHRFFGLFSRVSEK